MAKTKILGFTAGQILIVALLLVAGIWFAGGTLPFSITGQQAQVPIAQQVPTELIGTCEQSANVAVTYSVYDSIKNGTSLNSDYNVIVYEDGVYKTMVNAGTAFNVRNSTTLTLYLVDDDATHEVYGFIDSVKVGCSPLTLQSFRGMQDGSLSTIVYNSDDLTANTGAAPEALAVGADATGRLRIKEATVDGYWSTTEGGQKFLITADLNKVVFNDFEVTSVSEGSFAKVSTPAGHTSQDATNNQLSISYEITSDVLRNYGIANVYYRAKALGTTAEPYYDSNLLFRIADKELYQNTSDGKFYIDYYNVVSNADLGETNATDVHHFS